MIYNIGDVLSEVRNKIIIPGLNCNIEAINNRYSDDITLLPVDNNSVVFALSEGINVNPVVLIRANNQEARSNKGQTAKVFYLDVFIGFLPNNAKQDDYIIACYRYEEALLKTFKDAQFRDLKWEAGDLGAMQEGNISVYGIMARFSCSIV